MDERDRIRLQHMYDAAQEAVTFGDKQALADLENDRMRALAIVRCLEIIGEASATLSPEFKTLYPALPWRVMTAMRNRLIHAYFDVDLKIVVETVHHDLPPLVLELANLLKVK